MPLLPLSHHVTFHPLTQSFALCGCPCCSPRNILQHLPAQFARHRTTLRVAVTPHLLRNPIPLLRHDAFPISIFVSLFTPQIPLQPQQHDWGCVLEVVVMEGELLAPIILRIVERVAGRDRVGNDDKRGFRRERVSEERGGTGVQVEGVGATEEGDGEGLRVG